MKGHYKFRMQVGLQSLGWGGYGLKLEAKAICVY